MSKAHSTVLIPPILGNTFAFPDYADLEEADRVSQGELRDTCCHSNSDAGWAVRTVRAGTSGGTRTFSATEEASDKQVLTGLMSQSSPPYAEGRKDVVGGSKAPLTWGVEHDEDRGVFLHKLVKVFIGQVINGAALICPGSLGDLGLWRLWTGRPKTGRAQSKPRGPSSPYKLQPPGTKPPRARHGRRQGLAQNTLGGRVEG